MVAHEMLPRLAVVKADPDDLPLGEFGGVRIVDPATFLVDLDRLASSVREAAEAHAPARSSPDRSPSVPPPPVPSLHDPRTRRIDARRLAPIHRTVAALDRALGRRRDALAWHNGPHGELSGRTPLSLVLASKAEAVADMEAATVLYQDIADRNRLRTSLTGTPVACPGKSSAP
jgi:hypothetical protein